MQRRILLLLAMFWTLPVVLGAEATTPTDIIVPEDIVQESIRVSRVGTNKFTVFFTYTEAGAKKSLSFSEAHAGQKVRTRVGDFLFPEAVVYRPRDPAEHAKWREGWLLQKTSKFIGVSEADAQTIVAGLRGNRTK